LRDRFTRVPYIKHEKGSPEGLLGFDKLLSEEDISFVKETLQGHGGTSVIWSVAGGKHPERFPPLFLLTIESLALTQRKKNEPSNWSVRAMPPALFSPMHATLHAVKNTEDAVKNTEDDVAGDVLSEGVVVVVVMPMAIRENTRLSLRVKQMPMRTMLVRIPRG
jgi:hypothetical protein